MKTFPQPFRYGFLPGLLLLISGGLSAQGLQPTLTHDLVKGNVLNEREGGVSGVLEFHDPETDKMVEKTNLDANGFYEIMLPKSSSYYFLIRNGKFTYFFKDESHILKTSTDQVQSTITVDFQVYQYEAGTSIILHDLNFATNLFDITDNHKPSLRYLADFLRANPKMKIQVGGHTDNVGSEVSNTELSMSRAKAVMDYLVKNENINDNRVSYYGYGETRPISSNETEAGRALNRRTSFIIIEN